jgi:asparagine synthase (glutamine-hydrolysing)
MCGIAGWAGPGVEPAGATMAALLAALAHRGPDASGWCGGAGWAIGARRLAIVDLETGDQPVANEAGDVHAVLNGEIYNYRELRERLAAAGHRLRSRGDTEVLVHLWEDEGEAMLARLRGMFALAIVDERRRTLFLARDRVGKKPLYWMRHGAAVVFASEPKALRAAFPEARPAIGREALRSFLMLGFVPEGQCVYAGWGKLPPGSCATLALDGEATVTPRRYWRLALAPDPGVTFAAACDGVGEALAEAAALRLRADVPIAAFLSGGIDSGVVTALAARAQPGLRALHVTFGDGPGERELARASAAAAGVELAEIVVDAAAGRAALPELATVFDEPLADPSCVPTLAIARAARYAATVVLNGDGGDEAFAGYRRFLAERARALPGAAVWGRAAGALAALLAPLAGRPPAWGRRLAAGLTAADPYLAWGPVKLAAEEAAALLGGAPAPPAPYAELLARHAALDPVNRMRALELELFLPGDLLVKMDRATMAASVEARSPLLDHVVLERAAAIPPALLLRGWRTKAVLRAAARELLPARVRRAPKRGFEAPLESWLAGPWAADVRDVLEDPAAAIRRHLDPAGLPAWRGWQRRPDSPRAARAVYTLLTLEHWLRRWA